MVCDERRSSLRYFEPSQQAGEAEEGVRGDSQPGISPAPRIVVITKGTEELGRQFSGVKSEHVRFTPLSISLSKCCLRLSYALNTHMPTDDLGFIYLHEGVLIRVLLQLHTQIYHSFTDTTISIVSFCCSRIVIPPDQL